MELIIHLSDLHFSLETKHVNDEVQRITNLLNSFIIDNNEITGIVIAITGDLTMEGMKEEFNLCHEFINKIKLHFRKRYPDMKISVISCPGNHDLVFEKEFTREEFQKMNQKQKYDFYNNALKNYYDSVFNINNPKNWFYIRKKINLGAFDLVFTCLNTTVGSRFEQGETDRGLHSIPYSLIKEIDNEIDTNSINIMMMHHSAEWFEEDQLIEINKLKNNKFNIVLFGHEHINRDIHTEIAGKALEEICGGTLFSEDSIFNLICVNDNKTLSFYKVYLNNDVYEYKESGPKYKANFCSGFDEIYNEEFLRELNEYPLVQDAKFDDIFVFPTIEYYNDDSMSLKIDDYEAFDRQLKKEDYQYYIIEGDELSGKSELAKNIFISSRKDFYPILAISDDLIRGKIENNFRFLINKQYNNLEMSFSKYMQMDSAKKLIIIDDFDCIELERSKKIKKYIAEHFGKVVIIKSHTDANLLRNFFDEASLEKTVNYSILPMLYRKRQKLIKNICGYHFKAKTEQEIERMANGINETISKQLNMLNLNPQFVVLYVNSVVKNEYQLNASNSFNVIFESNIVRQLQGIKNIRVDEYLYLLQLLSYEGHVRHSYPLPLLLITEIIEKYNNDGAMFRPDISVSDFINNLEKAKILQKSRTNVNKYIFVSSNYYAFFVAKNIVSLTSDSKMDKSVINNLIKEMCFGVNGDILLYVAYILQGSSIINTIYEESVEFFENFAEEAVINPKICNLNYLYLNQVKLELDIPSNEDKINNLEQREKDENAIVKRKKEEVDYYNYTEEDLNNSFVKIKQALKYIELLSRLLPDFIHLPIETPKIVSSLYSYVNKTIYYVLKPYEVLFDKNSKILEELYNDGCISEEFKDTNMIRKEIQRLSNNFILNVYNLVARFASSKQTLYAFDQIKNSDMLSNELLDLMVNENEKTLTELASIIRGIDKKYENIFVTNYLKRIVRHYCLKNSVPYIGLSQSIVNRYLCSSPTKEKVTELRKRKR